MIKNYFRIKDLPAQFLSLITRVGSSHVLWTYRVLKNSKTLKLMISFFPRLYKSTNIQYCPGPPNPLVTGVLIPE